MRTVITIFVLGFCAVSAYAGQSIGHPTGKLGNRWFTHPLAKDVYIQRRPSTKKQNSSTIKTTYYRKTKVLSTMDVQKERLKLDSDSDLKVIERKASKLIKANE